MTSKGYVELDRELEQYLRLLLQGMGRTERLQALGLYATGLLLSGERKSIAPMAARLSASAAEADAMRQRLQQAVVVAKWEPRVLFARLAHHLNQELGDIEALIGDDTGIPRYGNHCVGTARQYSGTIKRRRMTREIHAWDGTPFRWLVMQGMAMCPSCVENSMREGVRTSWR